MRGLQNKGVVAMYKDEGGKRPRVSITFRGEWKRSDVDQVSQAMRLELKKYLTSKRILPLPSQKEEGQVN